MLPDANKMMMMMIKGLQQPTKYQRNPEPEAMKFCLKRLFDAFP